MPPVQLKLNNGSMYSKLGYIPIISGVISKCSVLPNQNRVECLKRRGRAYFAVGQKKYGK